jgi:hypothetical protein
MTNNVFKHILFLTLHKADPEHLIEAIANPMAAACALKTAEINLDEICYKILSNLNCDPPLRHAFELFLFSGFLLEKKSINFTLHSGLFEEICRNAAPEVDINQILETRWQPVPTLLVNTNKKAVIRYFMITPDIDTGRHWPEWTEPVLDKTAREAIACAATAGRKHLENYHQINGFYCFPITANHPGIITGRSMGLPIALGLINLVYGQSLRKEVIATGGIDASGNVSEVLLEKKQEHARDKNFRVFLYPGSNTPPTEIKGIDAIGVSCLSEAQFAYSRWTPECRQATFIFMQMQKDPEKLINNLASLPHAWIQQAAPGDCLDTALQQIFKHQGYCKKLAEALEYELMKPDLPLWFKNLLIRLVPIEAADTIFAKSPEAALKICALQIMIANHRGDVQTARQWRKTGDEITEMALRVGALNQVLDYFNNCLVLHHNSFSFSAAVPEWIRNFLEIIEAQYENASQAGQEIHEALGRMYGTLCQHFAFCGPGCFKQFEKYNHLAMKTLGAGISPEYNPQEWKRQLSYRIYACLDAEKFKDAEKSLIQYLEINKLEDAPEHADELSQWQLAALCRFLADAAPDHLSKEISHALFSIAEQAGLNEHPWQLIFWNLGRIAFKTDNPEKAEFFFRQSLKICIAQKRGQIIMAMGLLPLSGLNALAVPVKSLMDDWEKIRQTALQLNPNHFKILKDNIPEHVLKEIWSNPETLFPFSYR